MICKALICIIYCLLITSVATLTIEADEPNVEFVSAAIWVGNEKVADAGSFEVSKQLSKDEIVKEALSSDFHLLVPVHQSCKLQSNGHVSIAEPIILSYSASKDYHVALQSVGFQNHGKLDAPYTNDVENATWIDGYHPNQAGLLGRSMNSRLDNVSILIFNDDKLVFFGSTRFEAVLLEEVFFRMETLGIVPKDQRNKLYRLDELNVATLRIPLFDKTGLLKDAQSENNRVKLQGRFSIITSELIAVVDHLEIAHQNNKYVLSNEIADVILDAAKQQRLYPRYYSSLLKRQALPSLIAQEELLRSIASE